MRHIGSLCTAFLITGMVFAQGFGSLPVRYKTVAEKSKRLEIEAKVPVFSGASAVAKLASKAAAEDVAKTIATVRRTTKEDWSQKEWTPPAPYSVSIEPLVSVSTPGLISFSYACYTFTGGAHGAAWLPAFNFGVVNGKAKRLALQDLFVKGRDAIDITSKLVIEDLREKGASSIVDGSITRLSSRQANNFVVTAKGLQFLFEPYSVGSWAEGPFTVDIPFAHLMGHLDPKGPLKAVLARVGS